MRESPQQYTERVLGYLKGQDPMAVITTSPKKLANLLRGAPKEKLSLRPEPSQWSVTEILAHLADSEMVFAFRMRLIMGSNGVAIPAFDQDVWAEFSRYSSQDHQLSLEAYTIERERNVRLLKDIPKEMWDHYGMHPERGKETITRVTEMMAGHDINHLAQVEERLHAPPKRT